MERPKEQPLAGKMLQQGMDFLDIAHAGRTNLFVYSFVWNHKLYILTSQARLVKEPIPSKGQYVKMRIRIRLDPVKAGRKSRLGIGARLSHYLF